MNISVFEGRTDWKQIVETVPCPMVLIQNGAVVARCDAKPGEPCRNVSSAPGTLWANQPRIDWHQERKESAILAWRVAREEVAEASNPVPTAAGHSAYTSRGLSVPAPIQQQFIQSHQTVELLKEVAHAIEEGQVEESRVAEHQGDGESGPSTEASDRSQSEKGGQVEVQITNNEADRG
jgi:hypothetical protein